MKYLLFVLSILSVIIIIKTQNILDTESKNGIHMEILYEWKFLDYEWNCEAQKKTAIDSGFYDASACMLHDVDKAPDGRVFVASYKTKGSPVGIMTVSDKVGESGPLLRPYPNWDWWYEGNKCTTGFYRLRIKCNYLFATLSGKYRNWEKICPPQIFIFDLSNNKLVKTITIPSDIASNKDGAGLMMTLIVSATSCRNIMKDAMIYITDTEGYGLVVYDMTKSKFCRIESDYMKPKDTDFVSKYQTFKMTEGIFGLTEIKRDLYYSVTSGKDIYKMKKSKVDQCPQTIDAANKATEEIPVLGQVTVVASKNCALFFVNVPEGSILCADSSEEINPENTVVLAQDPEKLILQCSLKAFDDELLGMINNYQEYYINRTTNVKKMNFRIFKFNMKEIESKTKCFASCNSETCKALL